MFTLTQCTEIVVKDNRPLWIAFLNIKGAYDNVVQGKLWEIMKRLKVENGIIKIIKDIYRDNKVFITWEGKVPAPVEIKRGLR